MKCPRCGEKNYNEAYYCRNCGLAMGGIDEVGENFSVGNPRSFFGQDENSQPANAFADENTQQFDERPSKFANYSPIKRRYNQAYRTQGAQASYGMSSEVYSKKMTQISIVIILTIVVCIAMVILSVWCKETNHDVVSLFYPTKEALTLEIPTAPKVEIYAAKLSGSKHNVTSYTDKNMAVQFPIPKRYVFENSTSENFAIFNREFNNGTVTQFTAVIFSGDVKKEVDYFSDLQAEDGSPFYKEVTDTSLGEMTLLTLDKKSNGTTIYHAYVKLDDENYFHISLSNVNEEYKTEAKKLINLVVQDSRLRITEN